MIFSLFLSNSGAEGISLFDSGIDVDTRMNNVASAAASDITDTLEAITHLQIDETDLIETRNCIKCQKGGYFQSGSSGRDYRRRRQKDNCVLYVDDRYYKRT